MSAQSLPRAQMPWSAESAFLAILTLTAVHDPHDTERRLRAVHFIAERSPLLSAQGERKLIELQSEVVANIAGDFHAIEAACAVLPTRMHASAYAVAADVLLSSGAFTVADQKWLDRLCLLLELDADTVARIGDVIRLKNKY
ncbi:MAG: hypothetical protein QM759_09850 [Terricaulis sp.]